MSSKKDLYQAFKAGDDIKPDMRLFAPYWLILGGTLLSGFIVIALLLVTMFVLSIGS